MTVDPTMTDEMLHAFIDGELEAAQAAGVASLLGRDSVLATRVAQFRADKERLARLYGPLIARPLPEAWLQQIAMHGRKRPVLARPRIMAALAASILACVIGGWFTYRALEAPAADVLVAEALGALEETRPAERVLGADALGPAAERDRLLAVFLALPVKAPDLGRMGYALSQIRLYSDRASGKAAELAYRNAAGTLVTLYLRPSPGAARFDIIERGRLKICIWQDDVLSSVITGEMSAGEMLRLASLAYDGLTP